VDSGKGWKRPLPLEEGRHVGEAVIEAMKNSEDDGEIQNNVTQIIKSIGYAFEVTTILSDGEFTLNKCAELDIEDHGMSLMVADELIL
jgi:hypothetical protein